jgi:small conductance mechanosensitive channel
MQPLDESAANTIAAAQAMFMQLTALAVQYSFSILGAIILIVAGYFLARLAERGSYAGLKRVQGFDETLRRFFSRILRYAVLVVIGVAVLGQFGVQTASILAAIGAIGLAIGLALQGTLQNIAAGVMLLVLRPFRVGEAIETGQIAGTVQEIGLFATELKRVDGVYILTPNAELWKSPVTNLSRNRSRSNDITIGIGYDDDIELAQKTLLALARKDRRVAAEPAAQAFVAALGDSVVSVTLRYWTRTPDFLSTRRDLTKIAKLEFDAKCISMPCPQQEVVYREQKPQTPRTAQPLAN